MKRRGNSQALLPCAGNSNNTWVKINFECADEQLAEIITMPLFGVYIIPKKKKPLNKIQRQSLDFIGRHDWI